ncbi:serine/threonine protein kinase [Chloroflexota bacterium]
MLKSSPKKKAYKELKDRIERLKRVERDILEMGLPDKIFCVEIDSIRSKLKSPDIVNEVEEELASLKEKAITTYQHLKNTKLIKEHVGNLIDSAKHEIAQARSKGIRVSDAEELVKQASASFEIQEYKHAEVQLKEAVDLVNRTVRDAKPQMVIELADTSFKPDEWRRVNLQLINRGDIAAEAVELRFSPEVVVKDVKEPQDLQAASSHTLKFSLKPKDRGEVPLDIEMGYKDYQGKSYTSTFRFWLQVGEIVSVAEADGKAETGYPMPDISVQLSKKYKKFDPIGFGGFSDVYKAQRKKDGLVVALKVPRMVQFTTIQPTLFIDEAIIWQKLTHKNIIPIYEYGTRPYPWIAMEYMDGGSLRGKVGKLGVKEAIDILLEVCDALYYTHHLGVVHRDIKPDNILFDNEGTPKVGDWGLGKLMLDLSTKTGSSGTPAYSAPEQINPNEYGETGWWTDIYELAATAYELLTGKTPFTGTGALELALNILNQELIAPSKINHDIPKELDGVLIKAMSRKKDDRYKDVSVMMEDLVKVRKAVN